MLLETVERFVAFLAYIRTRLYDSPRIVFVLGGPGSGEGLLGNRLEEDYNIKHLSAGNLLRTEKSRTKANMRRSLDGV